MSEVALPPGWATVEIQDLITADGVFVDGDWVESKDQDPDGDVRLIQLADIGEGVFLDKSARFLTSASAAELRCTFLKKGDVLIARMPDPLGRACIFPLEGDDRFVTVVDVCIIRTSPDLASSEFLTSAINFLGTRKQIEDLQTGTTRKRISRGNLANVTIPLPPLPEQKRIVAKIEELFSELEAGEASLRKARRQLGVYRQSLLKQAFEGKLTQKWRTQNPDKLQSPATLLASAAEARRERWNGRGKHQPAIGPKLDAERPIPDCWAYASVDQVTLNFDGQRVPLKREDRGKRSGSYPYYGASGIIDDIDDFLFDGDYLLISEDGANLLSRSTPIAFQAHGKFWVNNHAHIVQPVSAMLMSYLEFFLNGRDLTRFISGTAQPKLTQANLDQVPVPLCSLPEQQEIVRLLDEQFEAIERNERELDAALQRSEALRQAILKKAFSGRLVPPDPADEPASTLLARLRTERTIDGKSGGRGHKP